MNTIEQTKYKQIYKDYEELGTLQLVGDKHELTRERVRQILAKGTSKGLFKYKAHNIHQMLRDKYSKEDFMEIIKNKTIRDTTGNVNPIPCGIVNRELENISDI